MTLIELKEGWRIFKRARHVKKNGFTRFRGDPEKICRTIIEKAFDEKNQYFRVSSGHFCEYYVRDFAWCCEALVALGYKKKVDATVAYAMDKFIKAGKIATMITPEGEAFDFPTPGPDTLGLFLYTITHTKNNAIVKKNKTFLQEQVNDFVQRFVDKNGLPKLGRFTSMRDQVKRKRASYDAIMIAVVARECAVLGLSFPLLYEDIKKIIKKTYWNGTYFFSDVQKQGIVTGDSNVFPFWTGVFTEEAMRDSAITAMKAAGLSDPHPLRYVSSADSKRENIDLHFVSFFTPEYETDTIWMHLGVAYLRILAPHSKKEAKEQLQSYTKNVKTYKTFLELYSSDGTPYETPFYITDEAMSWCAPYLYLAKQLKVLP